MRLKYTLAFTVFLIISFFLTANSNISKTDSFSKKIELHNDSIVMAIFQTKCNICHLKKKQTIFSVSNLHSNLNKINEQVFIKKRMPKGKKYTLTEVEYEIIGNWITKNQ
jgi:uncharacterized membrane protein